METVTERKGKEEDERKDENEEEGGRKKGEWGSERRGREERGIVHIISVIGNFQTAVNAMYQNQVVYSAWVIAYSHHGQQSLITNSS